MNQHRTITQDYHNQETDEETESVSARSEERESFPDTDDLDDEKRPARLADALIEAQGQRQHVVFSNLLVKYSIDVVITYVVFRKRR